MDIESAKKELIPLLVNASDCFYALGHVDIWDSDYYADELGAFCRKVSKELIAGDISDKDKRKLWLIFAPTCEWDDSVGDVHLGNAIFEFVNSLYGDIATSAEYIQQPRPADRESQRDIAEKERDARKLFDRIERDGWSCTHCLVSGVAHKDFRLSIGRISCVICKKCGWTQENST